MEKGGYPLAVPPAGEGKGGGGLNKLGLSTVSIISLGYFVLRLAGLASPVDTVSDLFCFQREQGDHVSA